MKKLIFLIPFMLVLSSCGDDNSSTPSNINSDQTSGQATAGIGGGDITPNPDGDNSGSTGDSTTNPADTSDTGNDESGTTTDPVNPGDDESGTSTDPVNPGSDEGGTTTDPVNPGGDEGGTTTDPVNPGGDEGGSEVVDVEVVPSDPGGTIVVEIVKEGYFNKDAKSFLFPAQKYYYRSLLSSSEQEVYDFLMEKFITFNQTKLGPCVVDIFFSCEDSNYERGNSCKSIRVRTKNYEIAENIYDTCGYFEKITRFEVNFQDSSIKVTPENLEKIAKYVLLDEPRTFFVASNVAGGQKYGNVTAVGTDSSGYVTKAYFEFKDYDDYSTLLSNLGSDLDNLQSMFKSMKSQLSGGYFGTDINRLKHYLDVFNKEVVFSETGSDTLKGIAGNKGLNAKGYAKAFAYLLNLSDYFYSVIYIEGTANYTTGAGSKNGASFDHAWLKVRVDGKWYNLDPARNANRDGSLYGFLQSDEEFYKNYTPNDKALLPESSSSYN